MKEILTELVKLRGVLGVAIIARDGVLVDKDISLEIDPETVSAMISIIGNTITRATELLHTGDFTQAIIDAQGGKIFLANADEIGYIALITIPDVNIGLIRLELKNTVKKALEKIQLEETKEKEKPPEETGEEKLV